MTIEKQYINPKFPFMIHGGDWNPDQWLDEPNIIEEDFRLMKLAGINSATLAIFAWAKIEPQEGKYDFEWLDKIMDRMAKEGMAVILATPSGARPSWLAYKYPEVLRVREDGIRNLFGDRHNHCLTSPVYRQKVFEIDRRLAEHYKNHPALFCWHLSNEYSGECYCDICVESFRKWLKNKYKDINLLNHEWWTSFWSHTYNDWSEINPPTYRGENSIHGLSLDWKRFITDQTVDFMKMEYNAVKEVTPDIPVTTNMMGTFPGLDYWKLAKALDIASWDMYPSWGRSESEKSEAIYNGFCNDLIRTLKNRSFLLMESTPSMTNWQEASKLKRPGVHLLSSLMAVGHGADSVQYFQWRKSRGGAEKFHGAVVDHYGKEDTRVFKDVAGVGSVLPKLNEICGSNHPSEVAVIYDWENRWAIETMNGVIKRERRQYDRICSEHYGSFWSFGINVDIPESTYDLSKYKLVIAPMLMMLKPNVAENIKNFVKNGGCFVATYLTGIVNENDLCFLGGFPGEGLQEVFGLMVEETDGLYPKDRNTLVFENKNILNLKGKFKIFDICDIIRPLGCEIIAKYGEDFYSGTPVLTLHRYGKGQAWYIAARTDSNFLNVFYKSLIKILDIKPNLYLTLPDGVTVQKRTDGKNEWFFIMNFNNKEINLTLPTKTVFKDVIDNSDVTNFIKIRSFGVKVLKKL